MYCLTYKTGNQYSANFHFHTFSKNIYHSYNYDDNNYNNKVSYIEYNDHKNHDIINYHHHHQQHDDIINNDNYIDISGNYKNCKINNPNITYLILECIHFEFKLVRILDESENMNLEDDKNVNSNSYRHSNDYHRYNDDGISNSNHDIHNNNIINNNNSKIYKDNGQTILNRRFNYKYHINYTYGLVLNKSEYSIYSMNLHNIFYTMRINNTLVRWCNITYELLEFYALSTYDIITLDRNIIEQYIPLMNNYDNLIYFSIPYDLFKYENIVGIITTSNEYYLKIHRKIYIINNYKQFCGYIYTYNAIIIENVFINWLHGCCDEEFSYLPNVFYENTLVRCQKLPEVYLMKNYTKHLIPNVTIFMKYGYDFSNVHIFKRSPCELDIVKEGHVIT